MAVLCKVAWQKKAGYRYTLTDGPTGAIFAFKKDTSPTNWNFFVSVRARGLLCRGYAAMKRHIDDSLASLGATVLGVSVNRIDYALDFLVPDFQLHMEKFVAPRRSKISPYFSTGNDLDDFGDWPCKDKGDNLRSVMRGGRFESVTVGTMPNRQVITYDKSKAAKDLRTQFWFDAWGLDPDDPAS